MRHPVTAIGKIGDIFSMQGVNKVLKGSDATLMTSVTKATAQKGSFIFNFVEFDSHFGHSRDIAGYAKALEWFDREIGRLLPKLRETDLMIFTADHGNDPSWVGTDHTREQVPVLCAGGHQDNLVTLVSKMAQLVLSHLNIPHPEYKGQNEIRI